MAANALSETQIQREGEVLVHGHRRRGEAALRCALREEAGETATLGLVAVHRESVMAEAAGMRDVILTAAERTFVPGVVEIEHERSMSSRLMASPNLLIHKGLVYTNS